MKAIILHVLFVAILVILAGLIDHYSPFKTRTDYSKIAPEYRHLVRFAEGAGY